MIRRKLTYPKFLSQTVPFLALLPYLCRPKSVFADSFTPRRDCPMEKIELITDPPSLKASEDIKKGK